MSSTQKSILSGMTILSVVGLICKIVGALYRIPLAWLIGDEGMGTYQLVFPTYNMLLTISSAGLPVAISRMVSFTLARDDPRNARRIFRVALCLLSTLGLIATLLMLVMSPTLALRSGDPSTQPGFVAIAPALLLVCAMSALRGFMQGQQNMVPTATSQLIEQVGKVFISLPLAYLGSQRGIVYGAAGALMGITLVEAVALLYMVLLYFRRRSLFQQLPQDPGAEILSSRSLSSRLVRIAIPITISACIVPLAQFVDSAMLLNRMMVAGLSREVALPLYGLFSGLVIRLINSPTGLALAVAMSLVPAISAAMAVHDRRAIIRQSDLGIRFAFLIGFPCSVGMSLLAEPIMAFFYAETLSAEHLRIASELLSVSSLTVVLFTVVQATSSILQGLHKQRIPMYTLVAGVACKIVLNYTLVGIPQINIHGAPISSIVCYTVSMVPNLYYVLKHGQLKFNWMGWIVRPGVATAAMGLVVFILRELLPMNRLWTLVEVLVGIAVYIGIALLVKAITPEDLRSFRRGNKKH